MIFFLFCESAFFSLTGCKLARKNPREVAQVIADHIPANDMIAAVEIAGPGFINILGDILHIGAAVAGLGHLHVAAEQLLVAHAHGVAEHVHLVAVVVRLSDAVLQDVVREVRDKAEDFGRGTVPEGERYVNLEYVSANPSVSSREPSARAASMAASMIASRDSRISIDLLPLL